MATERRQLSRILLIDDDAISREVMSMLLEIHGIPIDTAEDGAQALALLDETETDAAEKDANGLPLPLVILPVVILMDTQMPGLSGMALVEALRQRSRARIIAISGSEVSDDIRQATDGFLLKPIEVEALVDLLEGQQRGFGSAAETTAHSGTKPHDSVVDALILGKFKAMMPANAVREIYTATAQDLKPRLGQLKVAMDAGNDHEVRRIAHAIKGGCAMVGLTRATEAASSLESSNGRETYAQELAELLVVLEGLEGILGNDSPL